VPMNSKETKNNKNLVILCGLNFPFKILRIPIIGLIQAIATDNIKNKFFILFIKFKFIFYPPPKKYYRSSGAINK